LKKGEEGKHGRGGFVWKSNLIREGLRRNGIKNVAYRKEETEVNGFSREEVCLVCKAELLAH